MKTLNRPMFRYGGPIKEGVMNGIRENKKHGGSMGENQGNALVGDPAYPKTDGREHHFAVTGTLAALGLGGMNLYRGLRAGRTLNSAYKGWSKLKNLAPSGRFRNASVPKIIRGKDGRILSEGSENVTKGLWESLKNPRQLGMAIRENPFTSLSALTLPNAAYKAAPGIGSALVSGGKRFIDAVLPGEQFKEEAPGLTNNNINNININEQKRRVGMPENLTLGGGREYKKEEKELTEAEIDAANAEARNKKMENYRKILDIKGMGKDATYKSLIDASKIIQEGGNLKEGIKDGSLIAKLTGAASKRFDKVSDTEAALRGMVVKGEIQKEMNADENKLDKEYKRMQIAGAKKAIAGDSLTKVLADSAARNSGKYPTGSSLASLARPYIDITAVEDITKVNKWLSHKDNAGKQPMDYLEELIIKTQQPEYKGQPIPSGTYVIGDRILTLDSNGKITPAYPGV